MTVSFVYEGANVDDPQELLNIAQHHCQANRTHQIICMRRSDKAVRQESI
jgi:hypothetical protein